MVYTVSPAVRVSPPVGVSNELAVAVARTLGHLPDQVLRAMGSGLKAHAVELAPGVLFRGGSSGGCAVGITLRELAPDAFRFGRLRFWGWQRWRRGIERDVACRYPRLKHLQLHFDNAVAAVQAAGREPRPATAVGLWLAASAEAELSSRWSAPRPTHEARQRRGRGRTALRSEAGQWS